MPYACVNFLLRSRLTALLHYNVVYTEALLHIHFYTSDSEASSSADLVLAIFIASISGEPGKETTLYLSFKPGHGSN